MKTILIIFSVVFTLTSYGQETLEKKLSSFTCNCINNTKNLKEEDFVNCFQNAMDSNIDLILKESNLLYNDTTYETGYKFGQEIFERISVSMIYSCKPYYNLVDSLRYVAIQGINKDSVIATIISMNKSDTKYWDEDFYTQRGVMYFQISDLDNALKDFDKAINLDQNALQSIYFKAWSLELKKNFDEAFLLYSNLATLTKKNYFNIFAAIAKQKKNRQ
jgi:tetratricopeptide (TPR) repeat protein